MECMVQSVDERVYIIYAVNTHKLVRPGLVVQILDRHGDGVATVPENLRKSGRRKNAPNPLFHSCFTEDGFT
jgi:hypothetical protein